MVQFVLSLQVVFLL